MYFLSIQDLYWIAALAGVAWYWWHAKGIRDRALVLVRRHCKDVGVLLLDDGLYLRGFWPGRDQTGRWCIRRTFAFEFTATGEDRNPGHLILLGRHIDRIELGVHRI